MPEIPQQIGHYRVVKQLGRGGQGVVLLAKDLKLGREVAIKMLRRASFTPEEIERLQREAQIASMLDHPGICPIYEIGDHDGEPYLVMRYVRGTTLLAKLQQLREASDVPFTFVNVLETDDDSAVEGRDADTKDTISRGSTMPAGKDLNAVLRLIEQVARALHEAHEAEIIHRDVKPGNIIVTQDAQPVLVDFGIATMARTSTPSVTKTGQTPGTPPYMSPEQTAGGRFQLDRRTDVYSLGVTLYECLTLKLPFDEHSQVARQVMFVKLPNSREINPAISKDLKTVLETALEKDRDRRYPTAAEFADDLRRVREHEPIKARPAGPVLRFARWAQRNPVVAASIISTFIILSVALIMTISALAEARAARDAESEQREALERARSLYEPLADLTRTLDLAAWSHRLWPAAEKTARGPEGMEGWIAESELLLARQPEHEKSLRSLEAGEGNYREHDRKRRIQVLRDLLAELAALPPKIEDMRKRLRSATSIASRTIDQHRARWAEVAAELFADRRFASVVPLEPQLGLIPIGKNDAGLFEFALAETGSVPNRGTGSRPMEIDEETAAVLVLLPGGTLRFNPNPDPSGRPAPPADLVAVAVGPYFIGKHEVTQSQWRRVMGDNPAIVRGGRTRVAVNERHPIENVSWFQCSEFCRHLGCRLPTQNEWEFAARSTPEPEWGDCDRVECLEGRENLVDLDYEQVVGRKSAERMDWHDGFPFSAPVGSFLPNKVGLHDTLGNVSEWCSDRFAKPRQSGISSDSQPSDPIDSATELRRVVRGSHWQWGAREAKCQWFGGYAPEALQPVIGLRIARSVDR